MPNQLVSVLRVFGGKRLADEKFLVVGGGIGGLVTALSLARYGIGSHVVEQAEAFGEIGAGLQLAPNASRILNWLGVLDRVMEDAFFPKRLMLMDAMNGNELTALPVGPSFVQRYGFPYFVTHRADLHSALFEACEKEPLIKLSAGKHVVGIEDQGEQIAVSFSDGTVASTNALIGADGINSTIRRHLIDDGEPVATGFVAYRGTVSVDAVKQAMGTDELSDMVIWIGPGLHLVQYPVRRGELCNQVAVFHSANFEAGAKEWGTPEELDATFAQTCAHVANSAKLMNRERRWTMFDRPPHAGWSQGNVTLVGDAAHPMFQYLAQGACQAMEDAVVLAKALAKNSDARKAFVDYEQERFPRASMVQIRARLFGEFLHIGGTMAAMRNYLLEKRQDEDFSDVDWLYAYSAIGD